MTRIEKYDHTQTLAPQTFHDILIFLHKHLDEFGDPQEQIKLAMEYAMQMNGKPGGFILAAYVGDEIAGAVVLNKTGMNGYIPDNILVYIATHKQYRGKGIGKQLMQQVIAQSDGDIALHVEPENPAKRLYESLGFTNKYLEMRLQKNK